MLEDDCKEFVTFVCHRDPVVIVDWTAKSSEIEEVKAPWEREGWYCLWNQHLLPSLQRKFIALEPNQASYYRVDSAMPVIEFSYPSPLQEPWNGRRVLAQGRIWAGFEVPNSKFTGWYNAVARWIRKTFVRDAVLMNDYIGPAAYEWYREGGLLFPALRPPVTKQWLSWVEAQDQHRALFSR